MRSLLIRCYPAKWRARYGEEFEAILDERPLGPFDVADILLGALDAQLRLRRPGADIKQGRGFSMSLRIGGMAAILGALVWPIGAFVFFGSVVDVQGVGRTLLLITGSVALIVALAGLSAFQARAHPGLTWAAFAVPAVGSVALMAGILGITFFGDPYWGLMLLGILATFGGSLLFAIVSYRAAVLSKRGAMLLGIGSALSLVAAVGITPPFPFLVAALTCFGLGWFALGLEAIRLDRPTTEPRPA